MLKEIIISALPMITEKLVDLLSKGKKPKEITLDMLVDFDTANKMIREVARNAAVERVRRGRR